MKELDELTPYAVEWRYDSFTATTSFDRVKTRALVARVRSFVEQQIQPLNS